VAAARGLIEANPDERSYVDRSFQPQQVAGMVILIRGKGPPPADFQPNPSGCISYEWEMTDAQAAEFRPRSPNVPVTIIEAKPEPPLIEHEPSQHIYQSID
jgi:hypothetical protein